MKSSKSIDIERICKYCELAAALSSEDEMICSKYGVVAAGYHCRKFSYDPLKREPRRMKLDTEELEFPKIDE